MPALLPTKYRGTITWLGRVEHRASSLRATALGDVFATFAGVDGEAHSGLTRPACVRVAAQHPPDTVIRNVRQFSIVSVQELAKIAAIAGMETIDPAWLGASIVISGIPDFTHLPPSSRLQTARGTTLVVDMENRPCNNVARVIDQEVPGRGKAFRAASNRLRGVTAWVEREGPLAVGDSVTLHVPDQRRWAHVENIRAQGAGAGDSVS